MTIQKLPLELLLRIFQLVNREDLYDCLYICKDWYSLVKSIYFKYMFWDARKIYSLKKALSTTPYFQPFPMTEMLLIGYDTDVSFTKKEFLFLLSRLSNLKYLNLEHSSNKEAYLKMVRYSPKLNLEEIVLESDFIASEQEGGDAKNDDNVVAPLQRFMTQYHFHESLKHLKIRSIGNLADKTSFAHSLEDFTRLKTLEVSNKSDPNLTIFHLLYAQPRLTSLTYSSTTPTKSLAERHLGDIVGELKNLKHIKMQVPEPAMIYTDFFTNHSPGSLNQVDIHFTEFDINKWMSRANRPLFFELCKSLQNFNSSRLALTLNMDAEANVRFDYEFMNFFYQIVNSLAGEQGLHYSAVHQYECDSMDPGIDICKRGSNVVYHLFFDSLNPAGSRIPTPTDINHLTKIDTFKLIMDFEDLNFPIKYINYVKKHCSQLAVFQIDDLNSDCCFKAECLNRSNTSLENMTSITVSSFFYSEELIIELIKYCPKVEVFNYTIKRTSDSTSDGTQIYLSLEGLKYLHTLIFNILDDPNPERGSFFLRYVDTKRSLEYMPYKYLDWNSSNEIEEDPVKAFVDRESDEENWEPEKKYNVHVAGVRSLKTIELRKNNATYTKLDLPST